MIKNDIKIVKALAFDPPSSEMPSRDMYFADELITLLERRAYAAGEIALAQAIPVDADAARRALAQLGCRICSCWDLLVAHMLNIASVGGGDAKIVTDKMLESEIGYGIYPLPGYTAYGSSWAVFEPAEIIKRRREEKQASKAKKQAKPKPAAGGRKSGAKKKTEKKVNKED